MLTLPLAALSQVEAVALNPTGEPRELPAAPPHSSLTSYNPVADWKYRDFVKTTPGNGLGCDFAGTVSKAGEGSVHKEGEKVAGFIHGGNKPGHGAFSEYVKTGSTLVWKVPASFDLEEAAALGGIGPRRFSVGVGLAVRLVLIRLLRRHGLPGSLPSPRPASARQPQHREEALPRLGGELQCRHV